MRRRRVENEDSSLELLLDTMCNTFGGVMFIAISVFILLATMTREKHIEIEKSPGDPASLQQEIINLQTMLAELEQKIQLQSDLLKIKKSESLQQQINEILLMQKIVKEYELKITAAKLIEQALQLQKSPAEEKIDSLQKKILQQQREQQELQIKNKQVQQTLEKLLNDKIIRQQISFKLIRANTKSPFFLMIRSNHIWPIGPWQIPGKTDVVDGAVNHKIIHNGDKKYVSCEVKPACGIEIVKNNTLTNDFLQLLAKIPRDRIPKFFITPDSAESVFIMRSYLKKNNIEHGCSIAGSNEEPFRYQYTEKVSYEY